MTVNILIKGKSVSPPPTIQATSLIPKIARHFAHVPAVDNLLMVIFRSTVCRCIFL